jgi:hypothetical protein
MEYAAYMREQAARYRALAEAAKEPEAKEELRELAHTCEMVACADEDRAAAG